MSDIVTITVELLELFNKYELSGIQKMLILESAKYQIQEDITKDIISAKKEKNIPGVH